MDTLSHRYNTLSHRYNTLSHRYNTLSHRYNTLSHRYNLFQLLSIAVVVAFLLQALKQTSAIIVVKAGS
jgi:hypothetical protein